MTATTTSGSLGPRTPFERFLGLLTQVRPGEGRLVALFGFQAFLLLFAYYIVRALREGFILVDFGANQRAYAVGVAAALLMVVVPLYSALRRRVGSLPLVTGINWFFVLNLVIFYLLWAREVRIGFAFFVWVGLFGLMVLSQFWAFAAGSLNRKSGQRLFPVIMIGANLGALAGSETAEMAVSRHGMHGLMLIGTVALAATTFLTGPVSRAVPPGSRAIAKDDESPEGSSGSNLLGGFAVVFGSRYLLLLAVMVVLLNWVNTTGEFLLAEFVEEQSHMVLGDQATHDERAEFVTRFYAEYMLWYTGLGLLIQTFLVSRIFRRVGVATAALALPIIAGLGYGLIAFVPVFWLIRAVKIGENSIDYSLMSTVRHALFLPTSEEAKFDGKTAIDTFFWRLGDLIQALVVFGGTAWFGWHIREFALVAIGLSALWIVVTVAIIREYRRLAPVGSKGRAPEIAGPLPDAALAPGGKLLHRLPAEVFVEPEPGDVLSISAFVEDGTPLPHWLTFDSRDLHFHGQAPSDFVEPLPIAVEVENVDGLSARSGFSVRPLS